MARKVGVYTIKFRVRQAKLGREVAVVKVGKPFGRLVPPRKARRPLGLHSNGIPLSDEAAAESLRPLDEEERKLWEGDDFTDPLFWRSRH